AGGLGIDGKAAEVICESKGPALPGPVQSHQMALSAACSPVFSDETGLLFDQITCNTRLLFVMMTAG
ncbi:hypothetical protein, partial [Aquitalea palustris]|uniref:hypothetical protein n=1 Tax=Aquitalea palustris TaxID=2480983 RepID=UPI001F31315A